MVHHEINREHTSLPQALQKINHRMSYGINQHFNPYGNVIPIFVERAMRGEPLTIYGDGNQTRDFIEVRDIVRANLLALKKGAEGVFNIGTGTATSVTELARHVIQAVDREVDVVYAPPRPGEVLNSLADISKAERKLGFRPEISIEQGIRDYVAWFGSTNLGRASRTPE